MKSNGGRGEMGAGEWFAYAFNRTALGVGVLLGLWLAWNGMWLRVGGVSVMIVVYFYLHDRLDAP